MADERKTPTPSVSAPVTNSEHDGADPDDSRSPSDNFHPLPQAPPSVPPPSVPPPSVPPPVPSSVSGGDVQEVVTQVHESAGRRKPPSVSTLPESEEALRVFDEMSGMGTFGGDPSLGGAPPIRQAPREMISVPGHAAMEAETAAFSATSSVADAAGRETGGIASQEEAKYRDAWLIFEHCPCPLFRLDSVGRICTANTSTWAFLGGTAEELTGMRLLDTRLGRNFPDLQKELQRSTETGAALQQVLTFQSDETGSVRFLLWIVPLPYDSPPVAFSGIILPYPGNL